MLVNTLLIVETVAKQWLKWNISKLSGFKNNTWSWQGWTLSKHHLGGLTCSLECTWTETLLLKRRHSLPLKIKPVRLKEAHYSFIVLPTFFHSLNKRNKISPIFQPRNAIFYSNFRASFYRSILVRCETLQKEGGLTSARRCCLYK